MKSPTTEKIASAVQDEIKHKAIADLTQQICADAHVKIIRTVRIPVNQAISLNPDLSFFVAKTYRKPK